MVPGGHHHVIASTSSRPARTAGSVFASCFAGRRELWRLPAYLAVIAVDGRSPFGRQCLTRLGEALRCYG
jgi:hypothetical protein